MNDPMQDKHYCIILT